MSRIGIFGGTFDPVHNAHLILAQRARETCGLDRVHVIPTGNPQHRHAAPRLAAEVRRELLELAFADMEGFRVDPRELNRAGPSYSILTIEEMEAEHPGSELWFFLGADSVATLPQWHRAEELAQRVQFVALPRSGQEEAVAPPGFRVHWLRDAPVGISSTLVRERLDAGMTLRGYVPSAVAARLEA